MNARTKNKLVLINELAHQPIYNDF